MSRIKGDKNGERTSKMRTKSKKNVEEGGGKRVNRWADIGGKAERNQVLGHLDIVRK